MAKVIANEPGPYWKVITNGLVTLSQARLHQRVVELGYSKVSFSRSRKDLLNIIHGHERCEVCYDRFSDRQLRELAFRAGMGAHRRIDGSMDDDNRAQLIRALEKEDRRGGEFRRFLDLPAELRNLVYRYYVAEFPDRLKVPMTPPFSRVNKLLRKELLPIFYRSKEFAIDLRLPTKPSYNSNLTDRTTRWWLCRVAAGYMACIRRLHFTFLGTDIFNFRIDLDSKNERSIVQACEDIRVAPIGWISEDREALRAHLLRALEGLVPVDGKTRFTLSNNESLRETI